MSKDVEILWWCPGCGAENVDPGDTEVYWCSFCHGEFTFQELDPAQVVILPLAVEG